MSGSEARFHRPIRRRRIGRSSGDRPHGPSPPPPVYEMTSLQKATAVKQLLLPAMECKTACRERYPPNSCEGPMLRCQGGANCLRGLSSIELSYSKLKSRTPSGHPDFYQKCVLKGNRGRGIITGNFFYYFLIMILLRVIVYYNFINLYDCYIMLHLILLFQDFFTPRY